MPSSVVRRSARPLDAPEPAPEVPGCAKSALRLRWQRRTGPSRPYPRRDGDLRGTGGHEKRHGRTPAICRRPRAWTSMPHLCARAELSLSAVARTGTLSRGRGQGLPKGTFAKHLRASGLRRRQRRGDACEDVLPTVLFDASTALNCNVPTDLARPPAQAAKKASNELKTFSALRRAVIA
jgi:hypothetical protein